MQPHTQNEKNPSLFASAFSRFKEKAFVFFGAWLKKIGIIVRHATSKLLRTLAVLIVVGIPLLLLVVRFYGLGSVVRHRVEKALSGPFYDVKIHRLFFSMSDGLITEDLRLLEKRDGHRLLVHANRVTLFPNLSALATGMIQIDSLQLHHATIDVPLGNKEEPRLRLDRVEATIICPPEQLTLSNASFDICGIHARVSGNFLNPKTFAPHPLSPTGPGKIAQTIELVQKQLLAIHWNQEPPVLDIEVSGDLTHTESLRIDHIILHGGSCSYQSWQIKSVDADLEYTQEVLKLHQLLLEDAQGEFHLSGNADFKSKQALLNFSGTCDVTALSSLLFSNNPLADFKWIDPPHCEGFLQSSWSKESPSFQTEAHLSEKRFSYRGVAFDTLSAGCIFKNNRFLLRDLQIEGAPGSLHLDLMMAPQDYRLRLQAALLPQAFLPAATGNLQQFLSLLNFKDPLKISFEGSSPTPQFLSLEGSGDLSMGSSSLRDAWIDSCAAHIVMKNGIATFENCLITMGEGSVSGECNYTIKNQELQIPKLHSTVNPVLFMMWIDPHIADSLKDYRFYTPPELTASGSLGLRDPQQNDFHIHINSPQGLGYTLIHRDLSFQKVEATAVIQNQNLLVNVTHASLFGGQVTLKANVSIAPGNGSYGADVTLNNIDFQSITKLYFDYDTSEGNLNGEYHFSTVTGNDYAMQGKGNLLIKDGNVLALPIFGPLSSLMNDIIPGLGNQWAHRATADFTVKSGVINTKNLSIQSAGFSMIGFGDIYYLEDRMNMIVRLNVKGLPGIVLFPVSKLFEYISDGSAKHPTWHPKYMTLPKIPLVK
ncbi:MAG: AsmA-like C-terminal region-containing protein [Chthoniobacterales bacterium]|nr:AsmA-like C-terminal region-containing protein [Chthoniobacterales bacterium]